MKYDSKAYLFYKVIDDAGYEQADNVNAAIEMMGDFKLAPGSLARSDMEKNPYPGFASLNATLENPHFSCSHFHYNTRYGLSLNGKLDKNPIAFYVSDFDESECETGFKIIEPGVGLHIFTTFMEHEYYRPERKTGYAFYDAQTLEALEKGFDYSHDKILDMSTDSMKRLGFSPDDICFVEDGELGCGSVYDFAHNIFTSYSMEDVRTQLDGLNRKNDLTQKHLSSIKENKRYR